MTKTVYYDVCIGTRVTTDAYNKVLEIARSRNINMSELFRDLVNREIETFFLESHVIKR